jgi:ADP-ribose pyrophosphatase
MAASSGESGRTDKAPPYKFVEALSEEPRRGGLSGSRGLPLRMEPGKRRSSRLLWRSPLFRLYEDSWTFSGERQRIPYTRFEGPSYAAVVPVTRDGELILVKNYRPPVREFLWELPGGIIEAGERPETAARRELWEETGFRAGSWHPLGWHYPSPHLMRSRGYLFLATGLEEGSGPPAPPDPREIVRPVGVPLKRAYSLLRTGRIRQATALLGLLLAEPLLRPQIGRRTRDGK